jgi:hypothetical protein
MTSHQSTSAFPTYPERYHHPHAKPNATIPPPNPRPPRLRTNLPALLAPRRLDIPPQSVDPGHSHFHSEYSASAILPTITPTSTRTAIEEAHVRNFLKSNLRMSDPLIAQDLFVRIMTDHAYVVHGGPQHECDTLSDLFAVPVIPGPPKPHAISATLRSIFLQTLRDKLQGHRVLLIAPNPKQIHAFPDAAYAFPDLASAAQAIASTNPCDCTGACKVLSTARERGLVFSFSTLSSLSAHRQLANIHAAILVNCEPHLSADNIHGLFLINPNLTIYSLATVNYAALLKPHVPHKSLRGDLARYFFGDESTAIRSPTFTDQITGTAHYTVGPLYTHTLSSGESFTAPLSHARALLLPCTFHDRAVQRLAYLTHGDQHLYQITLADSIPHQFSPFNATYCLPTTSPHTFFLVPRKDIDSMVQRCSLAEIFPQAILKVLNTSALTITLGGTTLQGKLNLPESTLFQLADFLYMYLTARNAALSTDPAHTLRSCMPTSSLSTSGSQSLWDYITGPTRRTHIDERCFRTLDRISDICLAAAFGSLTITDSHYLDRLDSLGIPLTLSMRQGFAAAISDENLTPGDISLPANALSVTNTFLFFESLPLAAYLGMVEELRTHSRLADYLFKEPRFYLRLLAALYLWGPVWVSTAALPRLSQIFYLAPLYAVASCLASLPAPLTVERRHLLEFMGIDVARALGLPAPGTPIAPVIRPDELALYRATLPAPPGTRTTKLAAITQHPLLQMSDVPAALLALTVAYPGFNQPLAAAVPNPAPPGFVPPPPPRLTALPRPLHGVCALPGNHPEPRPASQRPPDPSTQQRCPTTPQLHR